MCFLRSYGLLGAFCLLASNVFAGLPAESELPPSQQPSHVVLPSESALPPDTTPSAVGDQLPNQMPGEDVLPPSVNESRPEPAGPLPLAGSPDGIPWLQLDLRGHTAPVRSVEFLSSGKRLITAGEDKTAIVWSRGNIAKDPWRYERTIRWQIQRGTRGRIYALASVPGLLAIVGEGAMGGTGEILLVNPNTGDYVATLFDEQAGHRQVVVALDFLETAGGAVLASQSMDGRTLLWRKNEQGLWKGRVATEDDREDGQSPALAERLLAHRAFSAIVALDSHRVVVPLHEISKDGQIAWRLHVVDLTDGSRTALGGILGPQHWDSVVDMTSDARRTRIVSADAAGHIYWWDLSTNPAAVRPISRTSDAQALSLSLSSDGTRLAIGTVIDSKKSRASIEIWNLSDARKPRLTNTFSTDKHVLACSIGAQANEVAYSIGDAVGVRSITKSPAEQTLRGTTRLPMRVAFPKEKPLYHLGIGTDRDSSGKVKIDHVFDTDQLRLTHTGVENEDRWVPEGWKAGGWGVVGTVNNQGRREWYFSENGVKRARLPLTEERTGAFRSVCWLHGDAPQSPLLAAVGTSAGAILVVKVAAEGDAPVVRRFRGHISDVTSLAVSQDLRWLASASADATVRIWPIGGVGTTEGEINRWGAKFQVDRAGRLVIETIREEGPLYFRGARAGDEVIAATWIDDTDSRTQKNAVELREALASTPWDRVVEFELRTGRQAARRFQILPAWQQVASLVMDTDDEWAFWAPSGYYDASFEGHRLFGWQINRGLGQLPDFFLAAQFQGALERPAIMSRLMHAGSIEAAFRAAQLEVPADAASSIANTYRLSPSVKIVSTTGFGGGDDPSEHILRAQIRVPAGQTLLRAKAFANAVVSQPGKLVGRKLDGSDELLLYEWQLAIPQDPQLLIEVIAATSNDSIATDQIVLENNKGRSQVVPRMFLLAVGVDDYHDAQIPRLHTPVLHTKELTDLLRVQAKGLYRLEAVSLLNDRATRPAWTCLAELTAEQLQEEATPDDLLLVYLSGHGLQDFNGEQYYFVTADANYAEMMSGRYSDCLSFEDLSQFFDISCRKLVILDTCHAGAIQPLRHREMKAAVRLLQQDLLLTLSASAGTEEAVEGRFSSRLLEAIRGSADGIGGNRDGVVRLNELIAYVKQQVRDDSLSDAITQTPSAGPLELLPYATPAISIVSPADVVGKRPGDLSSSLVQ